MPVVSRAQTVAENRACDVADVRMLTPCRSRDRVSSSGSRHTACGACSRSTGRTSSRPARSRSWPTACCGRWSRWALILLLLRRGAQFRALVADRRTFLLLAGAAVVITFNWAHLHLRREQRQASSRPRSGYFINPLVTVLMGVFILGERLRTAAVGGDGDRRHGGRRADRRLRPAAVGGAGAGVLVRHLRADQEDRERRRGREPDPRDLRDRAVRRGVPLLAGRAGHRRTSPRTAPATRCCWARPAS